MDSTNILESVREDDYVEYFIFPAAENITSSAEEHVLENLKKECERITRRYTNKYLWHKDSFQLNNRTSISNKLSNDSSRDSLPPHLHGITHYGDNIEDEWFIVFLLQQLSAELDDVIIRVIDSDGEFLLIESAEHLMPWANPDTCENRVYLYKGNVHIIAPNETESSDEIADLTIRQALNDLTQNANITRASAEIQNSIKSRIKGYPNKIQQSLHNATIFVPIQVAILLKTKPQLISHAILAFCNRDPIDLRVCKAMKYFPPENRVYHRAVFTKCQYAMVTHSKYVPDRMTGWNLPKNNDVHHKSHSLGVQIACGFEILVSQAKNCNSSDLLHSKGWNLYLTSLKSKDYFDDLLEHSKEYNNRLNKAQEYYLKHQESMHAMPPVGREILTLLSNIDSSSERTVVKLEQMPADDCDSWLDVSPDAVDQMLTERYGNVNKTVVNGTANGAASLTEKLGQFLDHTSGIDGVEFPQQANKEPPADNSINFDADAFSCAVKNILNFAIPEDDNWDLESESDMSDYGHEADEPDMGPNPNTMDYSELSTKMKEYMDQMDKELAKTTIGSSFLKIKGKPEEKVDASEAFEDIETFEPVDIDVNALKNIMKSYKAQMGEAGPSSNMLGPMGVHFDGADLLNDDSD